METHQKLMLLCARTVLPAEMREEVHTIVQSDLDWNRLTVEAHRAGIAPLLWCSLKSFSSMIPEKTMEQLRTIYYNNLGRNLFFSRELMDLCRLFDEEQIPVVPLKGVLLAEMVYGNMALRQVSDMDLLIRQKDLSLAYELLIQNGFSGSNGIGLDGRRDLLLGKIETQIPYTLELHWKFKDSFLKIPEDKVWNDLTVYTWEGTKMFTLSREWTLLHLIHHLHCHGYPLKILVDVAETLRASRKFIDWEKVLELAKQSNMKRSLLTALQSVDAVLDCSFPEEAVSLVNSVKGRKWCSVVIRKKWFFSGLAKRIQDHAYLCAAFSALFMDGDYWDLVRAYWKRTMYWIRRFPHRLRSKQKVLLRESDEQIPVA